MSMKRMFACLLFVYSMFSTAFSQTYTASAENLQQRKEFQDMKFGLFIHWGASSVLGNGEWVMNNWDTKQSDWKITNTPYGKDAVKQLADECHKQGIKLFFYYSLLDWYRSDYQYETGRAGKGTGRTEKSNWENYIRFMKAQLTELLTNYG